MTGRRAMLCRPIRGRVRTVPDRRFSCRSDRFTLRSIPSLTSRVCQGRWPPRLPRRGLNHGSIQPARARPTERSCLPPRATRKRPKSAATSSRTIRPTASGIRTNCPQFARRSKDRRWSDTPLGLYLHIPFCRKRCKFCYFKVFTDVNAAEVQRYVDALCNEISMVSRVARDGRSTVSFRLLRWRHAELSCRPSN